MIPRKYLFVLVPTLLIGTCVGSVYYIEPLTDYCDENYPKIMTILRNAINFGDAARLAELERVKRLEALYKQGMIIGDGLCLNNENVNGRCGYLCAFPGREEADRGGDQRVPDSLGAHAAAGDHSAADGQSVLPSIGSEGS